MGGVCAGTPPIEWYYNRSKVYEEGRNELCGDRRPVSLFGKIIASAYSRDSGAEIGEDTAFLTMRPRSGGSVKNWKTVIPKGSVVEIHNIVQSMIADGDEYTVKIVDSPEADKIKALREEKERVLKRLSEINSILGEQ